MQWLVLVQWSDQAARLFIFSLLFLITRFIFVCRFFTTMFCSSNLWSVCLIFFYRKAYCSLER